MPHPTQTGAAPRRIAITIPASNGTITTIGDLITAAGYAGPIVAVSIYRKLAGSSTDRDAFIAASARPGAAAVVASDFTTHGQTVPAGEDYYLASDFDHQTAIRSLTTSPIAALAIVLG